MSSQDKTEPPYVGINAISLLSPLTGVGQYTLQLARAMQVRGVPLSYFYGPVWSERLIDNEADVRAERDAQSAFAPALQNVYAGAKRVVKAVIPRPYEVVRFLQQRWFTRGLRTRPVDVYHDPNFIPFRFNGPTVITIHDLSVVTLPHTHPRDRVRAIGGRLAWAAGQADVIITVSEHVRDEVIECFGVAPEKVVAIHNGVNPGLAPKSAEQTRPTLDALGLSHGGYVLAVGTLEPRKNLGRLCRAYRSLPRELRQRYPLVLAGMRGWGDTEFAADLDALRREGHLRLPGYLTNSMLADVYAGAALFVYPSIYEGFGLPVVEAMASGAPVVTSNVSSLPEVAGDAARLVDPLDEQDIAAAMHALLLDESAREEFVRRGAQRATAFSWDKAARETLAAYRLAIQRHG